MKIYKVIDKIMPGSLIVTGSSLAVIPDYSEKLESFPACYLYENANGQRFTVYTFVPTYVKTKSEWHNGIFRNYYRRNRLINGRKNKA